MNVAVLKCRFGRIFKPSVYKNLAPENFQGREYAQIYQLLLA